MGRAPPRHRRATGIPVTGLAVSGRRDSPALAQAAQSGGSGGFLRGALQTAAGVAGGALLFEGINSLFHHGGLWIGGGGFLPTQALRPWSKRR